MKYLFLVFVLASCSYFEKDNEIEGKKDLPTLAERDALYCQLSKAKWETEGMALGECDAALWTSIHSLQCDYANPSIFEYKKSGRLCRRPGCTCFGEHASGPYKANANFSKDMATGEQLANAVNPDADMVSRVNDYGAENNWTVCKGVDVVVTISKCLMSPKIIYRWGEIDRKGKSLALKGLASQPEDDGHLLTGKTEFEGHLEIVGILTEEVLYGGISDSSLSKVKEHADREPNNLLYQAVLAKFVNGDEEAVAEKLLAKFPADRLPGSQDWCSSYIFQRDEYREGEPNGDWLPCPEEGDTFAGTDYLFASWVLQAGK